MDQEQLKSTSVRLAASSNLRRIGRPLKLDAADLLLSGSSSTSSYGATSAPASRLVRDTSTSDSNNLMLSETRKNVVQDFLKSSSDSSRYQPTASNAERGLAKLRGPAQLLQQHPAKEDQNQHSRQQQQLSFSQLDRWFQSDQPVGGPTGSNLIRS
jgi:hypothetical protein